MWGREETFQENQISRFSEEKRSVGETSRNHERLEENMGKKRRCFYPEGGREAEDAPSNSRKTRPRSATLGGKKIHSISEGAVTSRQPGRGREKKGLRAKRRSSANGKEKDAGWAHQPLSPRDVT